MAVTAAAAASLASIVTSSSSSLSLYPSGKSFTHISPNNFPCPKLKPLLKSLNLKSQNFILSPLPLLYPLHICHCSSSSLNEIQDSITEEIEKNADEIEQEEEEEEGNESENAGIDVEEENKGFESADDRRLFVGNLPYSMTPSELSKVFAQAGQVQFIEIIYDKVTDRSRGFGFITMASMDEANEAIRMFDASGRANCEGELSGSAKRWREKSDGPKDPKQQPEFCRYSSQDLCG